MDHLQLAVQVALRKGPAGAEARVVHQEPDLETEPQHLVHHLSGSNRRGQVRSDHARPRPVRLLELLGQRVQAFAPPGHQDDVVAIGREQSCVLDPQTGGRAGDERSIGGVGHGSRPPGCA